MYEKLAHFLSNSYNIDINAFDIELENLDPVREDVDLRFFDSNPIPNTSINSYYYKESISREWKSIVIELNPQRVIQIAERLNEFLYEHNQNLIDLEELERCFNNSERFEYLIASNNIVFFLFRYDLNNSLIDIAIAN